LSAQKFAGVDPCPECGAPLLPDAKCESCGYDPRILVCENCGYEGAKCRNCGANLTENHHIILRSARDNWVWKRCAYCDWAIEKYLDLSLGEIELYVKPYEYSDSGHLGTGLIGEIFGAVIIIMIASALFPIVLNLTANRTGFTSNANITSSASVAMLPIVNLLPFIFVAVMLIVIYAAFEKSGI